MAFWDITSNSTINYIFLRFLLIVLILLGLRYVLLPFFWWRLRNVKVKKDESNGNK